MAPRKRSYRGNPNLKRIGVNYEFTQDQIDEWIKCAKDPIYFCNTYMKIVTLDHGRQPFVTREYQDEFLQSTVDNRYTICRMPRQAGKSTTVAGLILWHILFHEVYSVAILAHKQSGSNGVLKRVKYAYELLPLWLQQGVENWGTTQISLENGSSVIAASTSSSSARGESINLIYLDEFAFVPHNLQEEFFSSVFPIIASGKTSKVVITSTPNGLDMFYKMWTEAEQGVNDYNRIDVHWSQVPGRDEVWKEEFIRNTSLEQFRQEMECEFIGSTNTLIRPEILRTLVHLQPVDTHEENDGNSSVLVYERPEPHNKYVITVDTSRGQGIDYSAFIVFDVTEVPYRIVATYRDDKIPSVVYPNVVFRVAKYYNEASILVETNDIGGQVADVLYMDLEYEHLYMSGKRGRSGFQITGVYDGKTQLGIKTSKSVKRIGCMMMKSLVENHKIRIPDFGLIREMTTFVAKGQSYEAEKGEHDDLAMCLVLFSWLTDQQYFKDETDSDIRKELYNVKQKMVEEDLTPFGFVDAHGAEGDETFVDKDGQLWSAADDFSFTMYPDEYV